MFVVTYGANVVVTSYVDSRTMEVSPNKSLTRVGSFLILATVIQWWKSTNLGEIVNE